MGPNRPERNALKKRRSLKLLRRSSTVISHERSAQDQLVKNKARAGLATEAAADGKDKAAINLIEAEEKIEGGVRLRDYVNFMSFGAGWPGILWFLIINFGTAFAALIPSYLLARWTA